MGKYSQLAAASSKAAQKQESKEVKQPSNQATTEATVQPSNQVTISPARVPVIEPPKPPHNEGDYVEAIRLALKEVGKETTSYRLHEKEKEALDEMLYQLRRRKLKSNENEIMRIAINFIIGDYQANGDNSILVRALEHMRA